MPIDLVIDERDGGSTPKTPGANGDPAPESSAPSSDQVALLTVNYWHVTKKLDQAHM